MYRIHITPMGARGGGGVSGEDANSSHREKKRKKGHTAKILAWFISEKSHALVGARHLKDFPPFHRAKPRHLWLVLDILDIRQDAVLDPRPNLCNNISVIPNDPTAVTHIRHQLLPAIPHVDQSLLPKFALGRGFGCTDDFVAFFLGETVVYHDCVETVVFGETHLFEVDSADKFFRARPGKEVCGEGEG